MTFDPSAYDRQSREDLRAMIEEERTRQEDEEWTDQERRDLFASPLMQEDAVDPFAGIVDVEVNDGWDR